MTIEKLRKRDGRLVSFDQSKIATAINKAFEATYKPGQDESANALAAEVVAILEKEGNSASQEATDRYSPLRKGMSGDKVKVLQKALKELGFTEEQVYTTMELRMKCGIGKCGRCNIGSKYVCKDGPVFRYDKLGELPDEY